MSEIRRQQIGIFNLDDVSDVVINTPNVNDVLTFNGSNWVPATNSSSTPNQYKIIYRRRLGDDAKNGLNIENAVASVSQALSLAAALSPTATKQIAIICLDGDQDSNVNLTPYMHFFGPNMRLVGTSVIQNNCRLTFGEYYYVGGGAAFSFHGGTGGNSFITGKFINNGYVYAFANQGINYINVDEIVGDGSYVAYANAGSELRITANKLTNGQVLATGAGAIVDLSGVADVSGCTFSTASGGVIKYPASYFVDSLAGKTTILDTTDATSSVGSVRTAGGGSFAKKVYAGDVITAAKGVSITGYNLLSGSGGNSSWHMQGQFATFGDGVSLMYNMYADPTTGTISYPNAAGYVTRLHLGYDYFAVYCSTTPASVPTSMFQIVRSSGFAAEFANNLSVGGTTDASAGAGAIYTLGGGSFTKKVYVGTSLVLPVQSGGTRSDLNYYEKSSFSATFISAAATGTSVQTVLVEQIGSEIFLYIPAIGLFGNNSGTGTLYASAVIPSRFRPTTDLVVIAPITYTATTTYRIGTVTIGSNGDIIFYWGPTGTVFPVCGAASTMGTGNATYVYRITALT